MLVPGASGSGKAGLAMPLAAELGFTLLGTHRIKELLLDSLGAPALVDLAWSRQLGVAATDMLAEYDRPVAIGELITVHTGAIADVRLWASAKYSAPEPPGLKACSHLNWLIGGVCSHGLTKLMIAVTFCRLYGYSGRTGCSARGFQNLGY